MRDVMVHDGVEYTYCYDVEGMRVYSTVQLNDDILWPAVVSQCNRVNYRPDYVLLMVDDEGWLCGQPMLGNPPKFERIRRITGYLVGTLDRFNDAKRAEEAQRVKHSV